MTAGVDVNGNEDPAGKKFLFTAAAGNVTPNPRIDFCKTFPSVLGVEMEGVVSVGGITRENTWWSGSCSGNLVELVAPADTPLMASITGVNRYRRGANTSGTSFAAPYVAGIAARLLEIDPTRTPAELEALLKASPSRATDSGLAVPVLTIGMEMRKVK
jgi:subtilisin family serine protease